MRMRIDALSAFFLALLGTVSAGVSIFAAGYPRATSGIASGVREGCHFAFLGCMALLLLAADAYGFVLLWEATALLCFFLIISEHAQRDVRRAGFLFLLTAHVGALALLLCFGVLQDGGRLDFASLRAATPDDAAASLAFIMSLVAYASLAGVLPLHAWMADAHAAAPSPIGALMSGVMLTLGAYALLRLTFDLLDAQQAWWGVWALALGLLSALYGAVCGAAQSDMKRLLAYSSIENSGLILVGIGLTLLFEASKMQVLAALSLTAALYHCLNHGYFKTLLFLGTGSVLHATRQRALGRLGGLIHRMPWVAALALIGTLALAGLPPLNGFVSEWLLLQAFLFTPGLPDPYLNMLVPIAAPLIALTAALSAYVMVKFYGIVFLGQVREERLRDAQDADGWQRCGLAWLAAGCVVLGIVPVQVIHIIGFVTSELVGRSLLTAEALASWPFLTPINEDRASYSPLLVLAGLIVFAGVVWLLVRRLGPHTMRRVPPWLCAYPERTPRMQDTAAGFGQPIRRIFAPFFPHRDAPRPVAAMARALYRPFSESIDRAAQWAARAQPGRISLYLLYSFCTLLILLWFMR